MKITSRGRFHSAERSSPWCGGIGLHSLRGLAVGLGMSVNFTFFDSYGLCFFFGGGRSEAELLPQTSEIGVRQVLD
jgi:hypothetical protein